MAGRRDAARGRPAHASPQNDPHTTMCWRKLSKLHHAALLLLLYATAYLLISYSITPEPRMTFVREDIRVGSHYALIYVVAPLLPDFTDAEGAAVFEKCGKCFVTNNRGFLPMSDYDAILVHGDRTLLTETAAFMDPGKRYLLETNKICISSKFKKCDRKPKITSFTTKETFDLCALCRHLHGKNL